MKHIILMILLLGSFSCLSQTRIKMKQEGGVYTVPCKVNGLNLRFIFDTGASNVSISLSEATFMLKNGYLEENDIVGKGKFQTADGRLIENTHIILREVEIGGMKLYNVDAVVINNIDAPLLLGQSAIQKLGKVQLQGDELLILSGKANIPQIKRSVGAEWYAVYEDDDAKIEVDINSIKRENDYVTCFVKTTCINEKSRIKDANKHAEIGCTGKSNEECLKIKQKWEDFLFIVTKEVSNCKEGNWALLSSMYYDKYGSVIRNSQSELEWIDISPSTILSDVFYSICTQHEIHYQGQTYWMYIEDGVPFLRQYPESAVVEYE